MANLLKLSTFSDPKGSLTVMESEIPFSVKRVYYIYDVPKASIVRGGHRHKDTTQVLVCVKGYCKIHTNDGITENEFVLDDPSVGLLIETHDWHTMTAFSNDAILLVLASSLYDKNDYIDEPYS